jgi:hypothetical protein
MIFSRKYAVPQLATDEKPRKIGSNYQGLNILTMKIINKIFLILLLSFSLSNCKNSSGEKGEDKNDSIWNAKVERIKYYKSKTDSINRELNWKKTTYGLWKSKNGNLGLKTQEGNEQGITIDKYITTICCEGKSLNSVIDTLSFEFLGSSFYKDKNNIYTHYAMSDGGNFSIVENADVKTFKVIGDCYAKDKNSIYGERAMKMDSIDYKTFKTEKGCGCYAKDKNGFYFWDSKMDLKDIERTGGQDAENIIKKLKRL